MRNSFLRNPLVTPVVACQSLLLGLKLTGQIAWPWLSVFSLILTLGLVAGLFVLFFMGVQIIILTTHY